MNVGVVIPTLNEEKAVGLVVEGLKQTCADRVVVVDNGSTDLTAEVARAAGATVISESVRGYGSACKRGLSFFEGQAPDVVVFIDGDYSDYPEELDRVVAPIFDGSADLVIGSRVLGNAPKDALLLQARLGNKLACLLIARLYGVKYTDLGPFRAIRWPALMELDMRDRDYGWTVEMQVKAAKVGIRATEVPVSYRPRIGRSKITGTITGSLRAGQKILWTIFRERWLS